MGFKRTRSIRSQLTLLVIVSNAQTLFLAGGTLIAYEWIRLKKDEAVYVSSLAKIIGAASAAPLVFRDKEAANANLATLSIMSNLDSVCLYDDKNVLFSAFLKTGSNSVCPSSSGLLGSNFSEGHLFHSSPILLEQQQVGVIRFDLDLEFIYGKVITYALLLSGVFFAAALLSLWGSRIIRLWVTNPILELAQTAKKIFLEHDYAVRANSVASSEIGTLVLAFNQMLDLVRIRDQELQKQAQTQRSILESMGDGVAVCDEAGTFMIWNNALRQIFGPRPPKKLPPEHWASYFGLYKPDKKSLVLTEDIPFYRAFKGNETYKAELFAVPPQNPVPRWLDVAARQVKHAGEIIAAVGVVRDITEKKAEAERERLLQEAQRAIRLREEFLSIAAHELRTPITAVAIPIETLLNIVHRGELLKIPVDRLSRFLVIAREQVERLSKLVDMLLEVSRISKGTIQLDLVLVDLSSLVQKVVERVLMARNDQRTRIDFNASRSVVGLWDSIRLEQVIENLLTNALKYGADKPITITVDTEGSDAVLVVRDRGIGISNEDIGRIFGQFERAVSSHHFGGLGLGLYISQEIAVAHGGKITVNSTLGEGSSFIVRLPLRQEIKKIA